jgi:FMN reductase
VPNTIAIKLVGLSGSPRRPSRSRNLVEVAAQMTTELIPAEVAIYDMHDAGPGLGAAFMPDELTREARHVVDAVARADALIVSTPVYKGSYTGLFKHLFDLIEPAALRGKPVLLGATGGGPRHALMVEHQLRPLFGFFEALTMPTAVYLSDSDFRDGILVEPAAFARLSEATRQLAAFLGGASRIPLPTAA